MFSEFDVNKTEYLAFAESISCYTVGIGTHGGRGIGTGTLVLRGGERRLITADHVLDGADLSQTRFYMRPEGNMLEVSVRDGTGPRPRVFTVGDTLEFMGAPVRDKKNDLRILMIACAQQLTGAACCYDATKLIQYTIEDGTSVVIMGFPVANSAPLVPGVRTLGATSDHCKYDSSLTSASGLPSAFDPDEQFLLKYTRIEDDLDPKGFSGAAAWVNGKISTEVWRPNPVLAGVVTSYLPTKKLLVVTRVGPIIRLLGRV